jgi:5-formyltetrahydrofolate cyclo-ligase
MDAHQRESFAISAAKILQSHVVFQSSQHIGCYLALEDEFDCTPIINTVFSQGKCCYLPLLTKDKKLEFAVYHAGDSLQLNQYHIYEPTVRHFFPVKNLELVLLPFVGIDKEGNRLGRGSGYYDKTFSFVKRSFKSKPFLLGIGYECQKTDHLPHDAWDVKLNGVLTEHSLILFNI